MISTNIYTESC